MHRFVINATKQDKLLQVYKRQATKLNLNPTSVSIPYATLVPMHNPMGILLSPLSILPPTIMNSLILINRLLFIRANEVVHHILCIILCLMHIFLNISMLCLFHLFSLYYRVFVTGPIIYVGEQLRKKR